jgi:hypothetical protein
MHKLKCLLAIPRKTKLSEQKGASAIKKNMVAFASNALNRNLKMSFFCEKATRNKLKTT